MRTRAASCTTTAASSSRRGRSASRITPSTARAGWRSATSSSCSSTGRQTGPSRPLPFKSVDTGTGLERLTSVIQGVDSNYRTDLFAPIIERLAEFIGHDPETVESERFSYQVVADHSRAMTFLLAEGVTPSNEGPGYVLRRIMRRAVRHGRLLGITRPFLRETAAVVIDIMGEAYPQLVERRDAVLDAIEAEEEKFARTLEAGSARLEELVRAGGTISGADAFRLHDTFGFPIDLTIEMAAERGIDVDRAGFDAAMAEQRERSRGEKRGGLQLGPEVAALRSEFIGYPNETSADDLRVLAVVPGSPAAVVLDRTPVLRRGRRADRRPRRADRSRRPASGRRHAARR